MKNKPISTTDTEQAEHISAEAKPWPPQTIPEPDDIIRRTLRHYGDRHQIMKMAEEASELSAAILRYVSPDFTGKNPLPGMIEELADVEIMCKQMRLIFGNQMVDEMVKQKLARLEKRINGADNR